MKKHEGKIICITMCNLLLTIAVLWFYLYALTIYTFLWYYHIIILFSFIVSLAIIDITILALIILTQKGYGKIILVNFILVLALGGFGFLLNFIFGLTSYPLKLTLLLCIFCIPIIIFIVIVAIKLKRLSKKQDEYSDKISR
ncbi:MAG: hypothetical protein K2O04_01820 [Clostridiales bacterium]|nr:hypothetical protein [Clostridiales bacterium]